MERMEIAAKLRKDSGKEAAKRLRKQGLIPAVAYGPGIEGSVSLALVPKDMAQILNRTGGKSTPFHVNVEGRVLDAVVRDYHADPVSRVLMHCDLLIMKEDVPVKVDVPIRTVGKSLGEEAGGRQFLPVREVRVRCLPQHIPEDIEIDVSTMDTGHVQYVDQIPYPEGVEPVYRRRYPVVLVSKSRTGETSSTTAEDEEA